MVMPLIVARVVSQTRSRAGKVDGVRKNRPPVFRGRHFQDELIVLYVRWYVRYSLSYRDLEEMMAERGLSVDHSTIARWVFAYAPILNERMRRPLRNPNRSWRVDEPTSVWAASGPIYTGLLIQRATPSSSCSRP